MIGTILNAKVIGKTVSKNDPLIQSGVVVELPDGMKGTLHVKRMNGHTPEERAVTLSKLTEGTTVEVEVVSDTTVDGEPGFRVSQWAVLRRARKAAARRLADGATHGTAGGPAVHGGGERHCAAGDRRIIVAHERSRRGRQARRSGESPVAAVRGAVGVRGGRAEVIEGVAGEAGDRGAR